MTKEEISHATARVPQEVYQAALDRALKAEEKLRKTRESVQEFMKYAVTLSEEYLSAFKDWPMDKAIQGWEKSRWIKAAEARKTLLKALSE